MSCYVELGHVIDSRVRKLYGSYSMERVYVDVAVGGGFNAVFGGW